MEKHEDQWMGNFERIYPDDDPARQQAYERVLAKATDVYNKASATRRTSSWQKAVEATAAKQAERRGEKAGATPPATKRPPRTPSAAAHAAATVTAAERSSSERAASAAAAIERMSSSAGKS